MENNDLGEIAKRLRRIMFLAGNGFYQTIDDENKIVNLFFLTILKEAYKALGIVYQMKESGVVRDVISRD
ncbi:hypothetical protein [Staphylothermus hellenicus]|uniref:Uncharacterized protein n=1 Tax=Staphylothermus hellenicus (strain DSM 12710 / JCM 10830 / BK20S6-10-b1 / P8) TaxID=591019 RepID=D7D941_STAHD|nr:hypothetical protein [Staphylothermus hellenicus]ADI32287.1 hypothetical protein Shell_1187 [Staphylothermus hellenicus DSM 12710]